MAGLAPIVRQSGETRRERWLIRSASARLRTALVKAAWRWVACDDAAKAVYRRLVANTGSGKKAVVGVDRRRGCCCGA
jgi:transposase